jgi:hypothetical protein
MASNRARKHAYQHTDAPTTAEARGALPSRRTPGKSSARDPGAAPFDPDDEAARRLAHVAAIEHELIRRNAELIEEASERRAIGLVGLETLLIALTALAGLLFMWLVVMS